MMQSHKSNVNFPFEIFDAHHHLWNLDLVDYPWLQAKGVPRFFGDPTPIQKNYLMDDFSADFNCLPVKKTVHVQVGASLADSHRESHIIQSMFDANAEKGIASAIIAFCDLRDSERVKQLNELSSLCNLRGIRQIVGRSVEENSLPELYEDKNWREGLEALALHGLRFDLQLIPQQMMAMARVLACLPELPVALCHCGSPWFLQQGMWQDENGETQYNDVYTWHQWQQGLEALAALPNVVCKISGLSMFTQAWDTQAFTPIIHTVLDVFGASRCLLGSNFPVDKLYVSYAKMWWEYLHILEAYKPTLSMQQKIALFKLNCAAFYNI